MPFRWAPFLLRERGPVVLAPEVTLPEWCRRPDAPAPSCHFLPFPSFGFGFSPTLQLRRLSTLGLWATRSALLPNTQAALAQPNPASELKAVPGRQLRPGIRPRQLQPELLVARRCPGR